MTLSHSVLQGWSPERLAAEFPDVVTTWRLHRKQSCHGRVPWEHEGIEVKASFSEYFAWLHSESDHDTCETSSHKRRRTVRSSAETGSLLSRYPRADWWAYASYKYFRDVFEGAAPRVDGACNWEAIGVDAHPNEAAFWCGSDGSCTPCHYDSYGTNVVAQLHGSKLWRCFRPGSELYPTRRPYEESSVFSSVPMATWPLTEPVASQFPLAVSATAWECVLESGDVLLMPRHWWHYVEAKGDAVSANMWLDHARDTHERVLEAIGRVLVCSLQQVAKVEAEQETAPQPDEVICATEPATNREAWVNPGEEIWPASTNLMALSMALSAEGGGHDTVNMNDIIDAVVARPVLQAIAAQLDRNARRQL